jgi:sulfoxide reductase catalytic subunit YedY
MAIQDEITPKSVYLNRRQLMQGIGAGLVMAALPAEAGASSATGEELTSKENVTSYNNFYEFGTDKGDPAENAKGFVSKPWSVEIAGACGKPGTLSFEELVKPHKPEERIYRLRCVEGWSMVIPWTGIPLAAVLERFEPDSRAKFVAFETLHDPERMPGQKSNVLQWPYKEGLRMDEAMHPLTLLATGLYGEPLLPQNGPPVRLVVPWKYGFKSIKSIVKISFVETQPPTSWNLFAPEEYGFYSNVNPAVDHPRWSQATERRLGEIWRRDTLSFNGYGDQVASLYTGMDLKANF